jgi:hypothetical protein
MSQKNKLENKKLRKHVRKSSKSDRSNLPTYWVHIKHKISGSIKLVSRSKAKRLTSPFVVLNGVLRKRDNIVWEMVDA